ncbi:GNAT family N-acetyltransferase [Virgisporangium aurantiacum]|uniref:N-acetyltransferase n=1 Tax=Virgisporangium aurantiacum TaxID=175570 RepID=A0A8J3Z5Q7_9ACTN|nr:GNAT family N-acetyltransferase [Virgisporangium aurantiacum]GIJ55493.1 N-acetyltransferase [Virgisporangium aurantiacum]
MTDTISLAGPADRKRVLDSLVAAFAADPVLRHLFPDDDTYPRYATAFFGRLFDKRVAARTVWTIGPGLSVAMWDTPANGAAEPPGGDPLDDLPADARARIDAYDHTVHNGLPDHPFWYLGVLGTHPDHKGRRWGRALIADGLRRAADDGLPAVLETSNPGNVDIYRRAGFEVVGELTAGPLQVWVMERPPA